MPPVLDQIRRRAARFEPRQFRKALPAKLLKELLAPALAPDRRERFFQPVPALMLVDEDEELVGRPFREPRPTVLGHESSGVEVRTVEPGLVEGLDAVDEREMTRSAPHDVVMDIDEAQLWRKAPLLNRYHGPPATNASSLWPL